MRRLLGNLFGLAALLCAAALNTETVSAQNALAVGAPPPGILPDAATPLAYRLELLILPGETRFGGRTEIDVTLTAPTRSLYLHGRGLDMKFANARIGTEAISASYTEVDPFGVARLDFEKMLPAGPATLVFEYGAPFGDGAAGLFHLEVDSRWYAWTQFESIDARAAFPGFDQPGYKTPFTISVLTAEGDVAYSNARETSTTSLAVAPGTTPARLASAAGVRSPPRVTAHAFEATKPLPTYLVAFGAGPFAVAGGTISATPQRTQSMPVRIIGSQINKDKLGFALQETGPIVQLLERYFDRPFPFPKLDQIGSPIMPGAMENAGADTYGDDILFLGEHAPTSQKQTFGMVVAHELAHQWFGDLVTPVWWDDIWLNESFANWMGYRIGNEWRPDLNIGVGAIGEAFEAMDIDALKAGRPIHQPIRANAEIDSAFDAVTYGKGGQVVAMIAAFLGDEKFRRGVHLHLDRHAYANASTEDFFNSLADAAKEPRVVAAMKSFIDQQGVPVVRLERAKQGLKVSQKRYALLGSTLAPETWIIPLCVRSGSDRSCRLLDKPSDTIPLVGQDALMPNAGGQGYYRFSLPDSEWRKLLSGAAQLPPGEALAVADSLWAGFRAGEVAPSLLLAEIRAMATNPYSNAAMDGGERLAGLRHRGLIPSQALADYRAFLKDTYGPALTRLGLDPRAGRYASDDPDIQKLRADLATLLANEARDANVLDVLDRAAQSFLQGDATALDPSLYKAAFGASVAVGADTAAQTLFARGVSSEDAFLRNAALSAVGSSGDRDIAMWVLGQLSEKGVRPSDKLTIARGLISEPETREMGFGWLVDNYDTLVRDNGIFVASGLPSFASQFCTVEAARRAENMLRPKVDQYKRGALELDRAIEQANSCGVLQKARGTELASALAAH